MDKKLTKVEEFAKKIAAFAAEEGLSVSEIQSATYIAQNIASSSKVSLDAVEKFDNYPSMHCPLGGPFAFAGEEKEADNE